MRPKLKFCQEGSQSSEYVPVEALDGSVDLRGIGDRRFVLDVERGGHAGEDFVDKVRALI